ncbi:HNH endonuclease [Hymenobacter sp. HD11105]
MVDHIKPVREDGDFFEASNLQPLCNPCHARKSAKEGHSRRHKNRDSSQ